MSQAAGLLKYFLLYVVDHLHWNEYGTILEHEIQVFLRAQCLGFRGVIGRNGIYYKE